MLTAVQGPGGLGYSFGPWNWAVALARERGEPPRNALGGLQGVGEPMPSMWASGHWDTSDSSTTVPPCGCE